MILYVSLEDYYEFIKEDTDFAKYIIVGTITFHKIGECESVPVYNEFNPYHFADVYIIYVPNPK